MMSRYAFGYEEIVDLKGEKSAPKFVFHVKLLPRVHSKFSPGNRLHWPQRLHRVCVLLWRFPKLEVPFAAKLSVVDLWFMLLRW